MPDNVPQVLVPQAHGGALIRGRWKAGESGNPKGRPTAGASIREWYNVLAIQDLKISDLELIEFPPAKRIAAQRLIAAMEHPETRIGGQIGAVKGIMDDFYRAEDNERLDQGRGVAGAPILIFSASTRDFVEGQYAALPLVEVDAVPVEPIRIHLGDSYTAIASLPDQFILVESARGRGKTRGHLTIFMEMALKHPGSRWLVVRSTRSRLTDSAIATFVEQVLPTFRLPVPTCERKSISTYRLPNGSEFIFQGLDDPGRQQSVECAGVLVVEGCEIDDLETITALAGAMRQACTPPIEHFRCIVEVNPDAPSHPLNQIAEPLDDSYRLVETREQYERCLRHNRTPCTMPGRWKRVVTHWMDNPGFFDVVAWAFTAAGESYRKTLQWVTGNLAKRWVHGLWTASQGSVFGDVFNADVHVIDDFDAPLDWPEHAGWDPGIDHVTGMPFVLVAPTGDYIVRDEVYEGGKSIAEHVATNVRPRLQGRTVRWWGDPNHFFHKTAQSPESCADQAVKAGLTRADEWTRLVGPAKISGVNALLQLMQNTVVYVKTGQRVGKCIYFMRKCKHCIAECQSWKYKRNAKGEQLDGDDKYEDRDNHLIGDPLVGMIATGEMVWRDPDHRGEALENK